MNRFWHSFFIFASLLCFSNSASAQFVIRGKLINEAGRAVPSASIVISSRPRVGTVTNLAGEFSLQAYSNDTLVVDHLGYERLLISASNMQRIENPVYMLIRKSIEIPEIVVTPDGIKFIIKEAYSKIESNYPMEYPIAQGTFRKQMMKGDEYAFFGECNMDFICNSIPDANRRNEIGQRQKVSNIRISEDKFFDEMGYLWASIDLILMPYPVLSFIGTKVDNYIWALENISERSGMQIAEISFKESIATQSNLRGTVYISLNDRGIIAYTYTFKSFPLKRRNIFNTFAMEFSEGDQTFSVFYRKEKDKWFFNYARMDWISDAKITLGRRRAIREDDERRITEGDQIFTVFYRKENDKLVFNLEKMDSISNAKIISDRRREAQVNYEGKITMTYDYIVSGWMGATRRERRDFNKTEDPFIKLKGLYPKTDMSEFKVILPDYKF